MDRIIARIERKAGEEVRVAIREYNGHRFIDVRIYFENDEGVWNPTKKGITLIPDKVDELKRAVTELTNVLTQETA